MKSARFDCYSGTECPVEATLELIGGKWKGMILYHLLDGPVRFGELQRQMRKITQRMLTKQVRELEQAGLITRDVFPEVPPRVEYSLNEKGAALRPVLHALKDWGEQYGLAIAHAALSVNAAARETAGNEPSEPR